jgi:hypothetical protein
MTNLLQTTPSVTVLINSTDSFEDCWVPFFTLLKFYWPQCPFPLVLNTETKTLQFADFDIHASQTQRPGEEGKRIPWSDCLIRCLEKIPTEYVLYLQDDYFINQPVNQEFIFEAVQVMSTHNIGHVRLYEMDRGGVIQQASKYHPLLWEVKPTAGYRVNLQAGLWRTSTLLRYLVPGESGWQFERLGTNRAYQIKELFLCQSLDHFNAQKKLPVNYQPTGIIRGKWYAPAVVELFKRHHIDVDYTKRGFYQESGYEKLRVKFRYWARKLYMWILAKAARIRPSGSQA